MPSKEFPPKGTGISEPNAWDTISQENNEDAQEDSGNNEDAQEDLRDDESLSLEERINRSQKRENQLKDDENADEVIASERSFRMSLMEQLRAQNAANNEVTNKLEKITIPITAIKTTTKIPTYLLTKSTIIEPISV